MPPSLSLAGPSRPTATSSSPIHPSSAPPTTTSFPHIHAQPNIQTTANHLQPHHDDDAGLDLLPTRAGRKLCVRHKQMANQNVNAKLQKSLDNLPTSERSDITHLWATFSNAPHTKRKLILEGILTMCCFSQLSHLSDQLNEIIRIDPFSLLPREVNLRILGYLDAISLGRAAQVSKTWKALADDDLLWRRMCGQHIDRKCEKCGWGLPLLERRRLKVELKDRSPSVLVGVGGHDDHVHLHLHGHIHGSDRASGSGDINMNDGGEGSIARYTGSKVLTRNEALGGMDRSRAGAVTCDPVAPPGITLSEAGPSTKRAAPISPEVYSTKKAKIEGSDSEAEEKTITLQKDGVALTRQVRLTRPWKTVYCERLLVERNWRKGRCTTKTLKGHTDGVMCLQYHTALSNPSYPVLITGSYDKTVRVWNLDTGTEVRVMRGHTRAVRCLQFDQMLLFTGAMDGTVRMWNWRAGECLRVLEGHTDGVVCLNYNGYLLASGSADSTIQVWNFRHGSKFTLTGHTEWVNSVVIWDGKTSPGDIDPTIIPSFSASGGKSRANFTGGASPNAQSNSNSNSHNNSSNDNRHKPEIDVGTMLFSASDDMTIKMWDLTTRECVRTFEGHKAQVQTMRVMMVDMTEEEIKEAYERSQAARAVTPPRGQLGPISAFTPASQYPISPPQSQPGSLSPIHDSTTGFDPVEIRSRARNAVMEQKVYIHDTSSTNGISGPQSKDGDDDGSERQKKPILVTGSLDGTVKLWDVESGKQGATLFGHIEGVWAVDMDALRIASASHDRTVKVWDRESGNCVQTLVGHRGAVTSLQLSDDMIVSSSDDGDVMVWSFAPSPSAMAGLNSPLPLTTR